MEHSTADESDVVVDDLPATSGAHWANRDRDALQRRTGRPTPFRRPPAMNSYEGGAEAGPGTEPDRWDAFAQARDPEGTPVAGTPNGAWDAFAAAPGLQEPDGPRAPAASGRASFGVTGGPISGIRPEPVPPSVPSVPSVLSLPSVPGLPPAGSPATGPPPAGRDATTGEMSALADFRPAGAGAGSWPGTEPAASGDGSGGIGDFMNGSGREIRAHRVGDSAASPVEHRRSRLATAAAVLLSAVVLLGGAAVGVVFFTDEDKNLTSVLKLGSGDSGGKVATAALGGRTAASFELIAATTKVTVRTQDLGDRLFRITSAGDSGTRPHPVLSDNRVQLLLSPDGEGASGNVEVLLSAKVTWGLRFVGGTDEQIVDVTGGKVSSIDIVGGSRRVDLRLSRPTGTVPVRVTGALDELSVLSPAGSPVRVKVDSGAGTVTAGQKTLRDVKPGSTLTPKDWKVADRYDVDAASRVTLVTVRSGP